VTTAVLTRDSSSLAEAVKRLAAINEWRLKPALPGGPGGDAAEGALLALEREFVESQRATVAARASQAPDHPGDFVRWFEALENDGPGKHDPLFVFLEEHATLEEMTWFLRQEVSGEAGFDDLVALTQVKMPPRVKLELARNYWDEMGAGKEPGMHGAMLSGLAHELGVDVPVGDAVVWEAAALASLMIALATSRRYAYQSIGALGVIELTAPGRARRVNAGLKRLGVGGEARQYFALHATLDVRHSEAWNREVLAPLVASDSRLARAIAGGALMRLTAGAACFDRYRRELGLDESPASEPPRFFMRNASPFQRANGVDPDTRTSKP
jgi:hypothetical protein